MPFVQGETVGAYKIIEQLGQGGMATVYKAYHAALDRYVALKVLHPDLNDDSTFIARFQREARLIARLEHPHIVPIHDFAEYHQHPYLVMKYIEGENLKARLGRGPLTSAEIKEVVEAVGAALTYAHQQGILHRDVKPSNVMIASDGHIYLTDFGLARIIQSGESTLSTDSILGTPQYISPEQAVGKKDLDEGTDIYSFGVMLYEMVVGQVPFNADTPFSIIYDHIYAPLPLPHVINPAVPESVERVLLKALAKERSDRYGTIPEMVNAFKSAWEVAGVPMRGTAVMLPKRIVQKTGRASGRVDAPLTEAAQTTGEAIKPQKAKTTRPAWLLAAGGLAVAAFCIIGISAVGLFNSFLPFIRPAQTLTPAPTQITLCSGEQTWLTRKYFPEQEIRQCWDMDHYLTDLVYTHGEWTAVLGKNVGYTNQIYLTDSGLPDTQIQQYWDQDFDITGASYSNGQWLIVMSKGLGLTQSYFSSPDFPDTDVQDYWSKGYSITTIGYGDGTWLFVMSKGSALAKQVYFSEAALPEEKIRNYWDAGYDITGITYGAAQWLVVMSTGNDFTNQYYYKDGSFPEEGIKGDWANNYFITNLAFGDSLWVVVMSKP